MSTAITYSTSTEQVRRHRHHANVVARIASAPHRHRSAPVYGLCLHCGAIEVRLDSVTGHRDFSRIGESATYPVGNGCEVCS